MEQPVGIIITLGSIKYHTCVIMGTVFAGTGTVWEILTCSILMAKPYLPLTVSPLMPSRPLPVLWRHLAAIPITFPFL